MAKNLTKNSLGFVSSFNQFIMQTYLTIINIFQLWENATTMLTRLIAKHSPLVSTQIPDEMAINTV